MQWPETFSMEKDYMEKFCTLHAMYGFPYDEYFIDIGIPSDYEKAETDFKQHESR
jgi:D-glycero-alpha-D-manno-heptose 1-phosphate guanylyltransferase